ncbi:hypothetical protein [Microbulbifer sp. PSTR4-B]|uniref:hypothetical protein n=1 Tax=Microbulbifer sp. PSTR4-B TaxID=3243396 RepID=UPI00403926E6
MAALEMPVKHVKVGIGANSSIYLFAIKEEGSSCGKVFKPLEPKNRGDKTVTVNIPADREIFVANSSSIGSYSFCNVAGSFKSAQNKNYKLTSAPIFGGCGIVLFELDGDKVKAVELDDAKLDNLTGTKICAG